jgi:hypothetical protein
VESLAGDRPFQECFARSQRVMLETRRVPVLSIDCLLHTKIASADATDVDAANTQLEAVERRATELCAVKKRRIWIAPSLRLGRRLYAAAERHGSSGQFRRPLPAKKEPSPGGDRVQRLLSRTGGKLEHVRVNHRGTHVAVT